ncbi:MAG TPA: hypothetical protein VI386_30470 [Candidatus Sulfotelmatobacter sp.]
MNFSPPLEQQQRAPRVHLEGFTPAVLRLSDGRRVPSNLEVISSNGGLLSLSQPIDQGLQVKLLFLTGRGSVLGSAEMLSPVASTLQPFRFVTLAVDDERRIDAIVRASMPEHNTEQIWIDKLRAASPLEPEMRRGRLVKTAVGAFGLITLALASAVYFFHFQLLR